MASGTGCNHPRGTTVGVKEAIKVAWALENRTDENVGTARIASTTTSAHMPVFCRGTQTGMKATVFQMHKGTVLLSCLTHSRPRLVLARRMLYTPLTSVTEATMWSPGRDG